MPNSVPAARLLRFGVFELDPRAGELRKKGARLRLPGQPLARENLCLKLALMGLTLISANLKILSGCPSLGPVTACSTWSESHLVQANNLTACSHAAVTTQRDKRH